MDPAIAEVDAFDPANERLLRALYDVSAAARADRPFEVWAPWPTAHRTWTTPRGDQDDVLWSATLDGEVVGFAQLALPHLDNTHTAFVAGLFVPPEHRRRGIGSALLEVVLDRCRAAGRSVVMTAPCSPVDRAGAGESFLVARGFELGIAEVQQVCDLDATAASWPAPPETGYRLEVWQDRVPDALVAGYCAMGEAFVTEAPTGDLDLEDEVWTPERVAERDERFLATGRHQHGVLAYAADGTCVGTTELFVNDAAPWRALQGGTLVLPGHRGHRLGLALKLANLQAVRARFPECRYVFTAVAGVNAPMNAVNELLGFRPVERLLEMQRRI